MLSPLREALPGLALAATVAIIALVLLWVQRRDRKRRGDERGALDLRYHSRQDLRRAFGTVLMLAIAGLIAAGSMIDPGKGRPARQTWAWIWIIVFLLVLLLLLLALADWVAIRLYAWRKLRSLRRERSRDLDSLRATLQSPFIDPPPPQINSNGKHRPD